MYYYLISKFEDEFNADSLIKFNKCYSTETYISEEGNTLKDKFQKEVIRRLGEIILEENEDNDFGLLIHFGRISGSQKICRAITLWKEAMNTDKLKTVLPISSKKDPDFANELYIKLEEGFQDLGDLDLDGYKQKCDELCGGLFKKRLFLKLSRLALLIDEAAKLKEKPPEHAKVKVRIQSEIEAIHTFLENSAKYMEEKIGAELYAAIKAKIEKIIDDIEEFFNPNSKRNRKQIYKKIKELRKELLRN
jgi:hypothetical protein